MHGKDLVDGPIRHRIDREYRASSYFMSRGPGAFYGGAHLPNRYSSRRCDTTSDQVSGLFSGQMFGSVIRLLRPRLIFLDQFHAATVDYLKLTAACAEDDQRCPS
jgi:hypothetical protein